MLKASHDVVELSTEFRDKGRLQIRDVFEDQTAETLHRCLDEQVPWDFAFREDGNNVKIRNEELRAYTPEQHRDLGERVVRNAVGQYQFAYNTFMMVGAYIEGRAPHLVLHRVLEYFNSAEYLGFMRSVTGMDEIMKTDAQATRYMRGQFLRMHDDKIDEEGRLVAYVLNLTKNWVADWGGLLHFQDDEGNVTDIFMPHFNSLSMFKVPARHFVSCVAPYAEQPRYAITGWFRTN